MASETGDGGSERGKIGEGNDGGGGDNCRLTMSTQKSHSLRTLFWRLFGASILLTLSRTAAIMAAKSFNSAVTQSYTPKSVCSESPSGDWTSFGIQCAYCLLISLLVLRLWYHHGVAHASPNNKVWFAELWDTKKYIAGEVLGWAFKELTAIGVALIAGYLGYVEIEEGEGEEENEGGENGGEDENEGEDANEVTRWLRDALQGDAPLSEAHNNWMQVAAYAIYATILFLVAILVFVPLMKYLKSAVHFICKMFEISCGVQHKVDPKHTHCLAEEFATESMKISQAYVLNGVLSGMLAIGIYDINGGDPDNFSWGAFGLLEVYALILMFAGALIFGQHFRCFDTLRWLEPIAEYYKDVWGYLAGFALGSIATSPGGIMSDEALSGITTKPFAADAFRAFIVSMVALCFLFYGSCILVYHKICCCKLDVSSKIAQHTSYFYQTAASLAFAWAWEDCTNDFICDYLLTHYTDPLIAVWINAAVLVIIMVPLATLLSIEAQKRMARVQEDIDEFNGNAVTEDIQGKNDIDDDDSI